MEKPDKKKKKSRSFRLALIDAISHERLWSIRYTRTAMIIAIVFFFVLLVVGIYSLVAYTPVRSLIPGYPGAISRRQAVQNALRIDSLETRILQWELYAENLRRVVSGAEPFENGVFSYSAKGSLTSQKGENTQILPTLARKYR